LSIVQAHISLCNGTYEYQYHHPHNGEDKYFRVTQLSEYGSHCVVAKVKDLQKSKN
jgi:hypothetical protein